VPAARWTRSSVRHAAGGRVSEQILAELRNVGTFDPSFNESTPTPELEGRRRLRDPSLLSG
jgi:hypothetical protein